MVKIDSRIKIGTRVKIYSRIGEWFKVTEIPHGKLVKLEGLVGSFQRGHIYKFTNSKE